MPKNFRFRHFGGEWISKSCFASWFSCQRVAGRASPWLRRRRRMRWLQSFIVLHIVWHLQSIICNTDIKVMMFIRWRQSPTPSATLRASSYPQFLKSASLNFRFSNEIVLVFCGGAGDAFEKVWGASNEPFPGLTSMMPQITSKSKIQGGRVWENVPAANVRHQRASLPLLALTQVCRHTEQRRWRENKYGDPWSENIKIVVFPSSV